PVAELQQRLYSENDLERLGAAQALRRHGREAAPAVRDLIKVMQEDADPRVRHAAAQALGEIGPPAAPAVPVLIRILVNGTDEPLWMEMGSGTMLFVGSWLVDQQPSGCSKGPTTHQKKSRGSEVGTCPEGISRSCPD